MDLPSDFSGGLVEITALTTLIGSSTAMSLVLGERGGVGLAVAAMSAFGILSIVKACIAGASPDWLRASLGVRDAISDAVLGVMLDLRSRYKSVQDLARRDLGRAGGVAVRVPAVGERIHLGKTLIDVSCPRTVLTYVTRLNDSNRPLRQLVGSPSWRMCTPSTASRQTPSVQS
jgi:hypothetical protein